MDTIKFSCKIAPTDPGVQLGMEIWLDDLKFFDQNHIDQHYIVEHEISDDDGDRELRFVLKNKQPGHTRVDAQGNILSDAVLSITDISFDGVDCDYLISTLARYHHDYNGSRDPVVDKFYETMGCNGTVSLKFSTPIYLWLLENM
jgi:hypothetical protein